MIGNVFALKGRLTRHLLPAVLLAYVLCFAACSSWYGMSLTASSSDVDLGAIHAILASDPTISQVVVRDLSGDVVALDAIDADAEIWFRRASAQMRVGVTTWPDGTTITIGQAREPTDADRELWRIDLEEVRKKIESVYPSIGAWTLADYSRHEPMNALLGFGALLALPVVLVAALISLVYCLGRRKSTPTHSPAH